VGSQLCPSKGTIVMKDLQCTSYNEDRFAFCKILSFADYYFPSLGAIFTVALKRTKASVVYTGKTSLVLEFKTVNQNKG
jgi:hypothetical protein